MTHSIRPGSTLMATAFAALCAVTGTIAPVDQAAASGGVITERFGTARNWTVLAVQDRAGFNHCAARLADTSGIQLNLLAFDRGEWTLQLVDEAWPSRPRSTFDVTLRVDGRDVIATKGNWSGKSAFVYFGLDRAPLAALTAGRTLTVVTGAGQAHFALKGSTAAVRMTEACRDQNRTATAQNGTTTTAPTPASTRTSRRPGGRAQATTALQAEAIRQPSQLVKLSRADTIQMAIRYLGSQRVPFQFLPSDRNRMHHFPVNWKTPSGVIGGMMAIKGAGLTPARAIERLVAENAATCQARSHHRVQRFATSATEAAAVVLCRTGSRLESMSFRASRAANGMIAVVAESAIRDPNAPQPARNTAMRHGYPGPNEL